MASSEPDGLKKQKERERMKVKEDEKKRIMGKQDVRKGGSDASPSRFKPADNEKEKDSSEYE